MPELETNAGRLKDHEFPYSIIELYLGRREPDAALDAARNDDEFCEAKYYVGEWQLLQNNSTEARSLFNNAADTCSKTSIDATLPRLGAGVELKRLSASDLDAPRAEHGVTHAPVSGNAVAADKWWAISCGDFKDANGHHIAMAFGPGRSKVEAAAAALRGCYELITNKNCSIVDAYSHGCSWGTTATSQDGDIDCFYGTNENVEKRCHQPNWKCETIASHCVGE